jgi:hypothetical protein
MLWNEEKGCSDSCNSGLDKVGVGVEVGARNPPICVSVGVGEISPCAYTKGDATIEFRTMISRDTIKNNLKLMFLDFMKSPYY